MNLLRSLAVGLIKGYQFAISPLLGNRCRFYPTCSHYALEAYQTYGFFKATRLIIVRLSKCHPLHPGGVDLLEHSQHNDCSNTTTSEKRGKH